MSAATAPKIWVLPLWAELLMEETVMLSSLPAPGLSRTFRVPLSWILTMSGRPSLFTSTVTVAAEEERSVGEAAATNGLAPRKPGMLKTGPLDTSSASGGAGSALGWL